MRYYHFPRTCAVEWGNHAEPETAPDRDMSGQPLLCETVAVEEQLQQIDTRLIGLLKERQALCAQLRKVRADNGRPPVDTAHDRETCRRYRAALGPDGTTFGPALLLLCRR
jgi:chorismate mutase